ncbi:hypothetical protein [Nocardioides daphniae]|uniref:hypothetical protein n=1 Tax=Nocardioides daphniae TaxID=402297 RepID=UPI00131528DB|nr:hypothetical protein [Nocardioides daphniae]
MLDGDAARTVGGLDLPCALQALVLGAPGDRDAEPPVNSSGCYVDTARHLVFDLPGVPSLAVERQRLVQFVLVEVPLHVADDEQLLLDRAASVDAGQDVHVG